ALSTYFGNILTILNEGAQQTPTISLEREVVVVAEPITNKLLINATPRYLDRKSTRLNSSHVAISYAGFCSKIKTSSGWLTPVLHDRHGWPVSSFARDATHRALPSFPTRRSSDLALSTYFGNILTILNEGAQQTPTISLEREVVVVAEPITNKLLINATPRY